MVRIGGGCPGRRRFMGPVCTSSGSWCGRTACLATSTPPTTRGSWPPCGRVERRLRPAGGPARPWPRVRGPGGRRAGAMMGARGSGGSVRLTETLIPARGRPAARTWIRPAPPGGPALPGRHRGLPLLGGGLLPAAADRRPAVRGPVHGRGHGVAAPPERGRWRRRAGGHRRPGTTAVEGAVHHDTGRPGTWRTCGTTTWGAVRGRPPARALLDPERAPRPRAGDRGPAVRGSSAEWRRPGSPCAGGLVLALRDLGPVRVGTDRRRRAAEGAVVRPASGAGPPWPLLTDEGLNGLDLHVLNDRADELTGSVRVDLFGGGGSSSRRQRRRSGWSRAGAVDLQVGSLFDGFRDISYAYRFGRPPTT